MITQFLGETIPKWDPRLARHGKLESLLAEAELAYKEARTEKPPDDECVLLLYKIVMALDECVRVDAGEDTFVANCRLWAQSSCNPNWLRRAREDAADIERKFSGQTPDTILAGKLNVLRARIREAELMFCSETASAEVWWIQDMLNELSCAVYVAMWAGENQRTDEDLFE